MEEEGQSQDAKYTDINDSDLDRVMSAIKQNYPNDGERLVTGHLAAQGIIIPRAKLRASIHIGCSKNPIGGSLEDPVAKVFKFLNLVGTPSRDNPSTSPSLSVRSNV